MSTEQEVWKDILGFEGYYQVSNLGKVRSLDRVVEKKDGTSQLYKGRMMRPQYAGAKREYLHICLSMGATRIGVFVHQLVALAFLGEPKDGWHVHHINGKEDDNRASNLMYIEFRTHCSFHNQGEHNNSAVLTKEDVAVIKKLLKEGMRGTEIARKFGVNKNTIYNIRHGRNWADVEELAF